MVVHTWGFVQSRPDSPWVKVELRAEPGAVFRVSGLPYAAALSSLARIRSALQSMNVRWPGKALTLHVHPALRAREFNELDVPVALALLAIRKNLGPRSLSGVSPQECWGWTEKPGLLAHTPSKGFDFLLLPMASCAPWGHPIRFQPKHPSQCKKAGTFLNCSACSSDRPHLSTRPERPLPRTLKVAGPTSQVKARPRHGCASAPSFVCMPCLSVHPGSANPHSSAPPTPCFLWTALSLSPFSRRTQPAVWVGCSGLGDEARPYLVRGHRPTAGCCFSTNSQNGRGPQENRCGTSWTPAPFNCTGQKDRPIGPRIHGLWPP